MADDGGGSSNNNNSSSGGLMTYAATMMGSATSGILARFPCHPIDTMKARLQVQTKSVGEAGAQYRHLFHALGKVWRTEGLAGLYRGFGVTVIGSAPASCLYFTTYEVTREHFAGEESSSALKAYPFVAHFVSGMLAETVSCLLWVPIDVIKERQQIRTEPLPASSILRSQGLSGLYRGYGATLASFGPFSAFYFMFYEQLKTAARYVADVKPEDALPFPAFLASGATAGALASLLTNPLDMAKLRLQVQRSAAADLSDEHNFRYRNFVHGVGEIYRREGFRGLWKGAGARMAFHAPMTAISITLFEECKLFYERVLN